MQKVDEYIEGGLISGEGFPIPPYDRGWWLCKDCGHLFEAWSNPPMHFCVKDQSSV